MKRLARRIALSVKAQAGTIELVEDFDFENPKTRRIAGMLEALGADGKSVLLMVNGCKPAVVKSARNIPRVEVRDAVTASTCDILKARKLIICRSAVDSLAEGLLDEK